MTYRFGFTPTSTLLAQLNTCIEKARSTPADKPLYMYRDEATYTYAKEFIDNVLSSLIGSFENPKRRESAEKMIEIIQNTLSMLLKQVLGKASDAEALQSLPFLEGLLHQQNGQTAVGVVFPTDFSQKQKQIFLDVMANPGDATVRNRLMVGLKEQTDAITHNVLAGYLKTLPLGMIKRKAGDIAISAITKAVNMGLNQLLPKMSDTELVTMIKHFDKLLYSAD